MKNKLIALLLSVTGTASAQTVITFDDIGLEQGSFFNGNEYSSQGVSFSVDSNGRFDQLATYDTGETGNADADLEAPFSGGNLQGTFPGNALVIADDITDANNDGLIDDLSDQFNGGTIIVEFTSSDIETVGFSLIDTPEDSDQNVSIAFTGLSGSTTNTITWVVADLQAFDSTAAFADNFANNFSGITAASLGLDNIQSIDFTIESGAIDSISFEAVPEPSSTGLLLLGSLGCILRRRR